MVEGVVVEEADLVAEFSIDDREVQALCRCAGSAYGGEPSSCEFGTVQCPCKGGDGHEQVG